jgi:hypothetical protein
MGRTIDFLNVYCSRTSQKGQVFGRADRGRQKHSDGPEMKLCTANTPLQNLGDRNGTALSSAREMKAKWACIVLIVA